MKWGIGYVDIWGESIPYKFKDPGGKTIPGVLKKQKEDHYGSQSIGWVAGTVIREMTQRYNARPSGSLIRTLVFTHWGKESMKGFEQQNDTWFIFKWDHSFYLENRM